MIISLDYKSITLEANEVRPVAIGGKVFSCLTSTGQFFVSFDGGPFIPLQGGVQIDNRPEQFTSMLFKNLTSGPITLTFYCGSSPVNYYPVTVNTTSTNAPTYAKGGDILNLNGGATIAFNGVDNGHNRKQIIVTNLDAAAALYLRDTSHKTLLPVLAGESKTVELSGACELYNPNGGAVSYCVGEIFYA